MLGFGAKGRSTFRSTDQSCFFLRSLPNSKLIVVECGSTVLDQTQFDQFLFDGVTRVVFQGAGNVIDQQRRKFLSRAMQLYTSSSRFDVSAEFRRKSSGKLGSIEFRLADSQVKRRVVRRVVGLLVFGEALPRAKE